MRLFHLKLDVFEANYRFAELINELKLELIEANYRIKMFINAPANFFFT